MLMILSICVVLVCGMYMYTAHVHDIVYLCSICVVCACILHIYMILFICSVCGVCMYTYGSAQKPRVDLSCHHWAISIFIFGDMGSPWNYKSSIQVVWLGSDPLFLHCSPPRHGCMSHHVSPYPAFYIGVWDANSVPHALTEGTYWQCHICCLIVIVTVKTL